MCWGRGIKCCTVPDQLVVDKQLEFRVKVGKTNTEGGPVVGREHREKEVDGRAVSATGGQSKEPHEMLQEQKRHKRDERRRVDDERTLGEEQVERKGERRVM